MSTHNLHNLTPIHKHATKIIGGLTPGNLSKIGAGGSPTFENVVNQQSIGGPR